MALSQKSSQNGATAKKQQSISSFFTKSASTPKPSPTLTSRTPNSNTLSLPIGSSKNYGEESLFVEPCEDEASSPISRRVSRTPKRALEVQEELENNNDGKDNINPLKVKRIRRSDTHENARDPIPEASTGPEPQTSNGHTLVPIAANEIKKSRAFDRTSKYAFSSSPAQDEENFLDDEETKKIKEKLHLKFVKKLGRPDSIAEIKRRKWQGTEESIDDPAEAEDVDEAEEETTSKASAKGKKGVTAKKGGTKLTPMEKQFLEIKRKHLDSILIVEVGYKFKFFGEDARIAAKELSIVCIPGKMRYDEHVSEAHLDRFASASIPVHRLHVHVKRLVGAGHKVGVVRQLETAALKAVGDNRNAPFTRNLTNLYTKGTYIDDVEGLEGPVGGPSGGAPATGYLVCITETNAKGWGTDEKVHVGIVAVQPNTGDVIYDDFEDGFMRSEVETRLLHIAPCEILIVGDLSKATDKLVQHLSGSKTNVFGDKVRVERVERPKTMAAQAYSHVSNFYAGKMKAIDNANDEKASKLLEFVSKMAEDVTICLSAMIKHMSEYGLEHVFDLTKYFQSFSARSHMLLNGTSLTSLEIYQNQTDHSERGSLFWTLDRTKTRFGHRLLRKWVGRPLLIKSELEERIAAVEELKGGERTAKSDKIKHLLSQIRSDLEKSLIRIYYGKVCNFLSACSLMQLIIIVYTARALNSTADYAADRERIFDRKIAGGCWISFGHG